MAHSNLPTTSSAPATGRRVPPAAADDAAVHSFRGWEDAFGPGMDLKELLRRLWRRKGLIAAIVLIVTVAAAAYVSQLTPRYTASAKVLIGARTPQIVEIGTVLPNLATDRETIESEIQVITSRRIAGRVIDRLGLDADPEFNSALVEDTGGWSPVAALRALPGQVLGRDTEATEAVAAEDDSEQRQRTRLINTFLSKVSVARARDSRVITIAVEASSSQTAAAVANALAEVYLLDQLEAKFEATERATRWLEDRLKELREAVEQSEAAVEHYRREAGLVEARDTTLTAQQMNEINTRLVLARSERAEVEARLAQLERLAGSPERLQEAPEAVGNPVIGRLREQEADVQRQLAELLSELGPRHPRIVSMRAELQDIRGSIAAEVQRIVAALRNQVSAARAREQALEASLRDLEAATGELNTRQVQLRALEREAAANRSLLETFLLRFKETAARQDMQESDARIISHADPPLTPSFPQRRLMVGLAMIGAFGLAVVVALVLEHLDAGFRSTEQVEALAGVRALALVPAVRGRLGRRWAPEDYVLRRPGSAFAEALRGLHTGLVLTHPEQRQCKVVLVTSAQPGEGKTALTLSLGRLLAADGARVAVVDADLRRPRIARALGIAPHPGLIEVLTGDMRLDEALQADPEEHLDVLAAGSCALPPQELLRGPALAGLLARLSATHDVVLVDSPPVLMVADTRLLARAADTTIYVVRWAHTRREAALMGLKQLREAGAQVGGVVLNAVDVRKHANYAFADSGVYAHAARRYYAD